MEIHELTNIFLKEGYVLGCEWDYNDDSRGNFAPVICSACGRKRNFDLKEFEQEDVNG